MGGIQTPYLYIGMVATSFGFHIEDGDLGSLNYHHGGEEKVWYIIPKSEGGKLEEQVKKSTFAKCELFIRHKQMMVPPSVLKKYNIKFARVSKHFHKKNTRIMKNTQIMTPAAASSLFSVHG